jgi:hypothetical protein
LVFSSGLIDPEIFLNVDGLSYILGGLEEAVAEATSC